MTGAKRCQKHLTGALAPFGTGVATPLRFLEQNVCLEPPAHVKQCLINIESI